MRAAPRSRRLLSREPGRQPRPSAVVCDSCDRRSDAAGHDPRGEKLVGGAGLSLAAREQRQPNLESTERSILDEQQIPVLIDAHVGRAFDYLEALECLLEGRPPDAAAQLEANSLEFGDRRAEKTRVVGDEITCRLIDLGLGGTRWHELQPVWEDAIDTFSDGIPRSVPGNTCPDRQTVGDAVGRLGGERLWRGLQDR